VDLLLAADPTWPAGKSRIVSLLILRMAELPRCRNVVCFGVDYVGPAAMAIMADNCPSLNVTVVDLDEGRIKDWNAPSIPTKEPQLQDVVARARQRNLRFSTDISGAIAAADLVFIAVGTPTKTHGTGAGRACLIEHVEHAARLIGKYAEHFLIVVEKSTVPVGMCRGIRTLLAASAKPGIDFQILSNPEFGAEGTAVNDMLHPDRILIGHEESPAGLAAAEALKSIYVQWVDPQIILMTNAFSSELAKLTANAFLAQRVSSINAISVICEHTGADVNEVARACGKDTRIGDKFLQASVGFGGNTFQKDVLALVYVAEALGLSYVASYWHAVIAMNNFQRHRFAQDIVHTMFETLLNKPLTIYGVAFKANTDDTRESSAIYVCDMLLAEGAILHIYDPKVAEKDVRAALGNCNRKTTPEVLDRQVKVFTNAYECARKTHALIILTEWDEFRTLRYREIYDSMMKPAFVFDGRNIADRKVLREIGFCTRGIGVAPDSI
jgi:UDPglucose 6-dehydrogenase